MERKQSRAAKDGRVPHGGSRQHDGRGARGLLEGSDVAVGLDQVQGASAETETRIVLSGDATKRPDHREKKKKKDIVQTSFRLTVTTHTYNFKRMILYLNPPQPYRLRFVR